MQEAGAERKVMLRPAHGRLFEGQLAGRQLSFYTESQSLEVFTRAADTGELGIGNRVTDIWMLQLQPHSAMPSTVQHGLSSQFM